MTGDVDVLDGFLPSDVNSSRGHFKSNASRVQDLQVSTARKLHVSDTDTQLYPYRQNRGLVIFCGSGGQSRVLDRLPVANALQLVDAVQYNTSLYM